MKSLLLIVTLLFSSSLYSHCQLPCGIYHDELEFANLEVCIQTLHRANKGIQTNIGTLALNHNQNVRWVNLKDEYADKVAHSITFYFLQQRIKQNDKSTPQILNLALQILQTSMKVKQTVDQNIVNTLSDEINQFKTLYTKINQVDS